MSEFGCNGIVSNIDMQCKDMPFNRYVEKQMIDRVIRAWDKKVRDHIDIECNNRGINIENMDNFVKDRITVLRFEANLNLNFVHLDFIDKDNVGELLFSFDTTTEIELDGMNIKFNIG